MKYINVIFVIFYTLLQVFNICRSQTNNASVPISKVNKEDVKLSINNQDTILKDDTSKVLPDNTTELDSAADLKVFLNNTSVLEKSINTDAVFRGFYVVLALGGIFLIYIAVTSFRLRRHRAISKYKVIATKGEDRESFFPLAAEDGEDEEIFSASNHQGYT